MLALIIQIVSGAVGGQLAGALLRQRSLGPLGNSIAGIVGGGIGGQVLGAIFPALVRVDGLGIGAILACIAAGGVGGGLVLAIAGLVRSMTAGTA